MAIRFYDRFHPDYERLEAEAHREDAEPLHAEVKLENRSGKVLDVYVFLGEQETLHLVLPPNAHTFWTVFSGNTVCRVVSRDDDVDFKFSGYGTVFVPESGRPFEYTFPTNENGWSAEYGWGIPDLVRALELGLENDEPEKLPISKDGGIEFNNNGALNQFNALEAWKAGFDGTGVKVAVIDNGIIDHGELNAVHERDIVDDDDDTTPSEDDPWRFHALRVASVIAARNDLDTVEGLEQDITGIAPNAEIIDIRVMPYDSDGISTAAQGIRYAVDQGARIVQLSLEELSLTPNEQVLQAIEYAVEKNVLLVFAAGNASSPGPRGHILAAYDFPIVVGGNLSSSTLHPDSSSNLAGSIEYYYFSAPSGGFYPSEDGERYEYFPPGSGGTSFASPYLSGFAALILQKYPDISLRELLEKMRLSARIPGGEERPAVEINNISWEGQTVVEGTASVDVLHFDLPSANVKEVETSSDQHYRIEIRTGDRVEHVDLSREVEQFRFNDRVFAAALTSETIDDSLEIIFAYAGGGLLNDRNVIGQVVGIVESRDKADVLDYLNALLFPQAEDFMPSVLSAISHVYGIEGDSARNMIDFLIHTSGKSQEEIFWHVAESDTAGETIELLGPPGDLVFYTADSSL